MFSFTETVELVATTKGTRVHDCWRGTDIVQYASFRLYVSRSNSLTSWKGKGRNSGRVSSSGGRLYRDTAAWSDSKSERARYWCLGHLGVHKANDGAVELV